VEIVGVADLNPDAVGISYAREKGIFTTTDYLDLFGIKGLDLVIDLTGRNEVLTDLARKKPPKVGLVDHHASLLFYNIASFGQKIIYQEHEINASRHFTRALLSATTAGVVVVDRDFNIIRANEVASRRSGLTPMEARGRKCYDVLHQVSDPCEGPFRSCPYMETLETGEIAHTTHEVVDKTGQTVIYDATTYPIFNKDGEVVQVVDVFRDITPELNDRVERRTKAIKENLARMVQEDKLVSLGKLVASVAHEINNPIGSIITFNQLMLRTIKEDRDQDRLQDRIQEKDLQNFEKYLDLSVREAKRCGKIVSGLLSFSRQQVMESRPLDVTEILDLIVVLTSHRMELAGIELKTELGRGPFEVWGDYAQLQQCFMNLVFNAMEAMPEGGTLTISAGRSKARKAVWVEVTDTGCGIPEDVRESIFEPFVSTKTATSGVGLGLSMVYGIVRNHRGAIDLASELEKGTTFRITLPAEEDVDLRDDNIPQEVER
jgi:two-component system, NtrC family, sensor kinase